MEEALEGIRACSESVGAMVSAVLGDDVLRLASDAEVFEAMSVAAEIVRRAEAVIVEAVGQVEQRSSMTARAERASTRAGCASVTEVVQRCTRSSRPVAKRYQRVAAAMARGVSITTGEVLPEPSPVLCRSYAGASTGWDGVSRSA